MIEPVFRPCVEKSSSPRLSTRYHLPRLTIDMDEWRTKKKEERRELKPIPEDGMEWLNEEWDGEIKEEKRKPEKEMKSSQKRRKLEPIQHPV